ncbi:RDD family protein [Patulibacter sp.]|uniref:RDD family protein n=1 Tax=Patulibacter sp. TaxID=1912859 RepID=UPI00271ECC24|nr:RDD family protein [Patulibacter sp.]MDO9408031.1 RDD family protein [Patulibacter sp.]
MQDYHDRLTISTPEAVDVVLDLAGPGTRISSGAIDLALQTLVGVIGAIALVGLSGPLGAEWTTVLGSVGAFALIFFYDVAWELLNDGRTPGKSFLGLRVVRDDGRRVDGGSSVLRNLLRLIELPLFYAPGIILVTLTRKHQRIGDMVAGTLVVREPRRASRALAHAAAPDAAAPPDGSAADEVRDAWSRPPSAPEALRLDTAGLTDHDRSTARAFASRYRTLDPRERTALATAIASGLRERLGAVPPQATDEQLILEVARGASLRG